MQQKGTIFLLYPIPNDKNCWFCFTGHRWWESPQSNAIFCLPTFLGFSIFSSNKNTKSWLERSNVTYNKARKKYQKCNLKISVKIYKMFIIFSFTYFYINMWFKFIYVIIKIYLIEIVSTIFHLKIQLISWLTKYICVCWEW